MLTKAAAIAVTSILFAMVPLTADAGGDNKHHRHEHRRPSVAASEPLVLALTGAALLAAAALRPRKPK